MATVAGVDEKTRQHCEVRGNYRSFGMVKSSSDRFKGFLVVSLDKHHFLTNYCTIIDGDGIFRVDKSRLSEQTDHEYRFNRCTLSFLEEHTRDIQFAFIDEQVGTIFIRGNNI
jgi:hypothetical protein